MNAVVQSQAIEKLLARSAMYHALSMVLRHPTTCRAANGGPRPVGRGCAFGAGDRWWDHPDAETERWLASQEHRRLIDVVKMLRTNEGGSLPEAVRRLVTALDTASMTEWTQEHERIFGHSVQSAAPPYELEYGEEHSHRQPQELGDIAAFYQAFGLRVSSTSYERVDHIVAECEFMQYVLYKQACALDEGSQERADVCEAASRQFLADHLGRWGPAFCLRLSRVAGAGILGTVAEVTLEWLVQDCARMQVAAGPRDLPLRFPNERDEAGCAACALQQPRSGDAAG